MQENVIQHFKKIDSVFFIPHFVLQVLVRNGRKFFSLPCLEPALVYSLMESYGVLTLIFIPHWCIKATIIITNFIWPVFFYTDAYPYGIVQKLDILCYLSKTFCAICQKSMKLST